MTSTRSISPKPGVPSWALGHAMAVIAVRQVTELRRRRTERAELGALSDHELRDIGLSRGEARAIADGIYVRDLDHHRTRTGSMSEFAAPPRPVAQRVARAARMTGRALMAAMEQLRQHWEHRKSVHALMALDDHALKDIGLHRSGIGSAVRMGRDRSPISATGQSGQPASVARRR